jgi:hypothetical protein
VFSQALVEARALSILCGFEGGDVWRTLVPPRRISAGNVGETPQTEDASVGHTAGKQLMMG